ncbi:uncharacterized protein LOC121405061 [Drosophila obscura]|uniref:uncharacterized protein LOC121405061 n=1 Tax=Drosophila obscura TaxID=7282 RepID=UPI001BB1779A|nr:uncharacterized protein LOC121405061 [Drosophila obscura]
MSAEELHCEEHFHQHYSRLPTGEYSVHLPMKRDVGLLGDSYLQAKRQFENLESKFSRSPKVKDQYAAFIKEHLDLKQMSSVPSSQVHECKSFLPPHCILKEESSSTKLRVVFDGSAVTSSGFSLNELLMSGPTIQAKLFTTLVRFRTFAIGITGEICKMYRCVRVAEPQCILWRDSPKDDIQVFKLDTVTYGTKSASILAIRAMQQLAMDKFSSYPLGSKVVLQDFYVDDRRRCG